MSYLHQMLSKLTSNYNKDPTSNIGKLFTLISDQIDELKDNLDTIELYRDIDTSVGYTLDRHGMNLGQSRGNLGDDSYRLLLKTKIKSNLSAGDINTALEVVSSIVNVEISTVYLEEQYPATVYLETQLVALEDALLDSVERVGQFIHSILAAGIGLIILFDGTFEFTEVNLVGWSFSSSPTESDFSTTEGISNIEQNTGSGFVEYEPILDENSGFGSIEGSEQGGFFGGIYQNA